MDCFHDFCLACDKQTVDGPYCSQVCRLADLEKGNTSAPSSPLNTHNFNTASWARTIARSQTTPGPKIDTGSKLTPSSSRTSLTSTASSSSTMTEQARLELQDYFSSFDQTRAAKRRSSTR